MKNVTLTLEETIPHYDVNWVVMQMVNFRFAISWEQEEWETIEDLRNKVQEEFQKSREYCFRLTPIAEQKISKFNNIIWDLIKENPELKQKVNALILKYK